MVMAETTQQKNYEFYVETDLEKYSGEWVAMSEGKIVAHGKNVKGVAGEAREICGTEKFLLARVPAEETLIF